ncbi:MAG TPA: FixH family protein [Candidatus Acidoferrales bacterium]|nr:FixH family protein [Candidatus Acidoferrales bacterium]
MKTNFNPWPYGIFVFFFLLFCGMATVVAIATTHRESMVSENYYEQELKYQDRIDSAARAQRCGAHLRLDGREGRLLVAVPAQQVAQGFSGAIEFYRPSDPGLDCQFPLAPNADGSQTVDISKLKAGRWQVRVKWAAGGQNYFLEQKLTL